MNKRKRDYFDRQVEWVLARLPRKILRLLEEVPLHVEDVPSRKLMKELNIQHDDGLCGLFSGVAIDNKYASQPTLPDNIFIFRKGIFGLAYDDEEKFSRDVLREQIQITILHELAHFHGMSEDEIAAIGYG